MERREILKKIFDARKKRREEMWEALKANRAAYVSLYIVGALVIMAIMGSLVTPYNPYDFDLSRARMPPSISHPFGTDELGRDILSRILAGARYTIGISVASVALGVLIGVILGLVSGYLGGLWDTIIQRIVDVMLAFPTILLAIALVASLGQGVASLIIAIAVSTFPVYARLVRGVVLQIVSEDYIAAAKLLGKSSTYIMIKHVLPNSVSAIIVQATYYMGLSILLASALGFLGLGVPPPTPEWGSMIGSGRTYLFSSPHIVVFPGLFIMISALSFNLLGDGLRDALDPRTRVLLRRG
ncbi:MAG: ABC transporter permease [Desulfurococcales archaeon]|jgi:ABC-type dipeptide/oligopeptide/nickel transport system permease subunit